MKFEFEPQFSIFDIKRDLKLPQEPSKELAEFLGVMYGDGYSGVSDKRKDYMMSISGHSKDDIEYHLTFVKKLFENLFNVNSKFIKRKDQQTIYIRFRSKGLYNFLLDLGFSSPKNNLTIPEWIKDKEELLFAFLRGFVDTDSSFTLRNVNGKKYPRITTSIKDRILAKEIVEMFKRYEFSVYHKFDVKRIDKRGFTFTTNYIQINGEKNIEKFVFLIGFHNSKHISEYNKWKNGTAEI